MTAQRVGVSGTAGFDLRALGVMAVVRRQPEIDDAGRDADQRRRQERRAPAEPIGKRAR